MKSIENNKISADIKKKALADQAKLKIDSDKIVAEQKAQKTIGDNKKLLDAIAKRLIEVETMERPEFEELLKMHGVEPKRKLDIEHQS